MTNTDRDAKKGPRRRFAPVGDLTIRPNSKQLRVVHKDGSVTEHMMLQVPNPRVREELICRHYLRNHGTCFATDAFGVTIHSRDEPWDFDLGLSTGERFNLEITSIADGPHQFEADKREERLLQAARDKEIRLRDLRKLAEFFPSDKVEHALKSHSQASPDDVVPNPWFNPEGGPQLLLGSVLHPRQSMGQRIKEAIDRKAAKPHDGKEATALIVDCRATFIDDNFDWREDEELKAAIAAAPFPEIWFYVGYFSGNDGNEAEFSFTPLKLPESKAEQIALVAEQRGLDDLNRVIWS